MKKKAITSSGAPQAIGPYSQGISLGELKFFSGQIPIDPATGTMPEGIEAQTKQVLNNIKALLEASGSAPEMVIKTTVFMKNLKDFKTMNDIYAGVFPVPCPARSTVEVAALPKDALIEIECIAYAPAEKVLL